MIAALLAAILGVLVIGFWQITTAIHRQSIVILKGIEIAVHEAKDDRPTEIRDELLKFLRNANDGMITSLRTDDWTMTEQWKKRMDRHEMDGRMGYTPKGRERDPKF